MSGKRTLFIIGIVLFIVFIIVATIVLKNDSEEESGTPTTNVGSSSQGQSKPSDSDNDDANDVKLTKDEVSKHSQPSDCWTIINGEVYDITEYISSHPGGSEIERACGTDASTIFNQRETQSGEAVGSGTPHSSRASSQLNNYLLGSLEQ